MDQARQHHEADEQQSRGRAADSPFEIPFKGWLDIVWRTWKQIGEDRVTLIAAGVTYYLLLSLFPTLGAFVSIYGLFTPPSTAVQQVSMLSSVVPAGGVDLIAEQLQRFTSQSKTTLGISLFISLALALWSSSTGVKTMFEAMNIAYGEREDRNFFVLNGIALLFVIAGLLGAILMITVVIALPAVLAFLGLPTGLEWLVQAGAYLLLAVAMFGGILVLYRFGPSRQQAKWRWLVPGALFATVGILVLSVLFSWYSASFANFEKTYGSLAGLVAFLTWIWLSVTSVMVGAELSAEAEHQTTRDSTVGSDSPMGARDATMADTVGESAGKGKDSGSRSAGHDRDRNHDRKSHRHRDDDRDRGAPARAGAVPDPAPARSPGFAIRALALALPVLAMWSRSNGRRTSRS